MEQTSSHPVTLARLVRSRDWWFCVVALGVFQLGIVLLNSVVFPRFAGIFLEARDIGTLFSAAFSLGLYFMATTRPSWVHPRQALLIALVCVGIGAPSMVVGATLKSPGLIIAGTLVRSVGSTWIGCIVCLPLVDIVIRGGTRAAMTALCCGWALSYGLELGCSWLPTPLQATVFCITPFVVAALCHKMSSAIIERARSAPPASDLRVTNPKSFLAHGNTVFVMLVLLKMSFGFAMAFNSINATPRDTVLACVPALLIAIALTAATRPGGGLNGFYRASMLCVLAGFLLVNPLIDGVTGMPALSNVVLRAGSDLTRMFAFLLVAYLGSRNPMNALSVSLYLSAANSLGSVSGAQLGMLAERTLSNDPGSFALLLAAFVFAFVAYNVLAPHSFDFDKTARSIEAVEAPRAPEPTDTLAHACAYLAREHGLTPREAEALELLAHGRNTQAIQERMVVSRSTAKTHIRNTYAKLGVHAQQELIDLVEKAAVHKTDTLG